MARAKTLDFPAPGASGSKAPTRTSPSAPRASPSSTTGSPSGTPRKRAVTQSPTAPPSRQLPAGRQRDDLVTRVLHRLRAVQLAESDSSPATLPPWSDSPAPLVYRTSKGELSFAYDAAAREEGAAPRRPEDRVLPAVARRLEAERLRKLAEAAGIGEEGGGGEGGGGEGGGKGWLVSEWDREGPAAARDGDSATD
ncbi:hypothetical protein Rhopal_007517-T1 [Rhodotorula paludigena]|uniref:Uncharacterized protein n=1 Tax=Rhodotorula paludigena TaxID=86838 RepID=A0AAV5GYK1_9BASI|nr:hypothetical protein Rhopal_007517-T1 [Rhodotorula paludigena]